MLRGIIHEIQKSIRKHILQHILLFASQARRELDINPNDQVASLVGFLRYRHAPAWIPLFVAGLRRSWLGDSDRFAVDGADDPLPARESFLEGEVDGGDEVVAVSFEVGV